MFITYMSIITKQHDIYIYIYINEDNQDTHLKQLFFVLYSLNYKDSSYLCLNNIKIRELYTLNKFICVI